MLFCIDVQEVREPAKQCLVRTQLVGALAAEGFTHVVRQNTVGVGDRGDDPRDDFVLQIENRFRREGAIIGLGPEMGAGAGIDELYSNAQPGPRLAKQAALYHVARPQFLARRSADRLAGLRTGASSRGR